MSEQGAYDGTDPTVSGASGPSYGTPPRQPAEPPPSPVHDAPADLPPVGQPGYGMPGRGPFGQTPPGQPFGQASFGRMPYGPTPHGQRPAAQPGAHAHPGAYGGSYGQPQYGAAPYPTGPYGRAPVDPFTGQPVSHKSKVAAGLLQIFLGTLGVGRFYMGSTGVGIAQLSITVVGWLTSWLGIGLVLMLAVAVWALVDGITILAGNPRDERGLPMR